MAIQTTSELRTRAQEIRNETTAGANTAVRIGTLLDDFVESLDSITGHYWQHYRDSDYTVGSKLSIAGGVRTKLTNNGVTRTEASPNGYPAVWDTTTNKIVPENLDDFYTIRLDIKGWSDLAQTNNFDVEMDIGGGIGVISADTGVFIKGNGVEQSFNFSSQFFVGSTFITNGGELYITPDSDASFWDIGITISRTYTPTV
jgi:hypothetical protein